MIDLPPDAALIANTPRLRLVPVTPADAEEMFALLNDQRLHRHIGGLPPSQAELAGRYRALESRRSADGKEVFLTWVVRLVPLGEYIGEVRAAVTDDGLAILGFTIGHRFGGHGFATEAVRTMVQLLDSHVAVTTLETLIPPGHVAAQKLAGRLGMARDGKGASGWEVWRGRAAMAVGLAEQAEPGAAPRVARRRRTTPAKPAAPAAVAAGTAPDKPRRRRPAAAAKGRKRVS